MVIGAGQAGAIVSVNLECRQCDRTGDPWLGPFDQVTFVVEVFARFSIATLTPCDRIAGCMLNIDDLKIGGRG